MTVVVPRMRDEAPPTHLQSPYDGSPAAAWPTRRAVREAEREAARARRRFPVLRAGRLEANALALMITTVSTAVLGLLFWAVAARLYAPAQVGAGSAMISTLTLLATLAQFNLGNVYARFLPTAGRASQRFVFGGYACVAGAGVVLGAGFLALGLGDGIFTTAADRWWFPVMVAVLAIFGLQDFVLIAIQGARFVPVENVTFAVVKIVLLVLLATRMPHAGITVAWVVPAAVGVLVVSALLRTRGLPHARSRHVPPGSLPARRTLGGIVAAEYLSGAIGIVVPMALPLIVVRQLGAEANAYFAMPWLIASALNLLIWNVAASLLVEAASAPEKAPDLVRRALRLTLLIGGAGSVVELAGAPLILSLLGPGYADQGTDLLRAMAIAVPFNAVLVTWTTLMRIHNRMATLVVQQVLAGTAVLVLTVLLLPEIGITGAGLAYLAAQAGSAVVVSLPLLRMLRNGSGGPAPDHPPSDHPAPPEHPAPDHPAPDRLAPDRLVPDRLAPVAAGPDGAAPDRPHRDDATAHRPRAGHSTAYGRRG